MTPFKTILSSAALLSFTSGAALAWPPYIYDSQNQLVGISQASPSTQFSLLQRQMNNTWYQMQFFKSGFSQLNTRIFFSGNGCAGTGYILPNTDTSGAPITNLPETAMFDGSVIWGAVAPLQQNVSVRSELIGKTCQSLVNTLQSAFPAAKIDAAIFYPPFHIK